MPKVLSSEEGNKKLHTEGGQISLKCLTKSLKKYKANTVTKTNLEKEKGN